MVGGFEALRHTERLQSFFGEGFDPALYRMLLFGVAMVGIMVWRPRGIVGSRNALDHARARPRDTPGASGQRRQRMKPWQADPLLKVEHLTMRFGGLTRRRRCFLRGRPAATSPR